MINGTQITIVGNLGADPEMRYTPTGQAVTSFSVGVQNRRTRQDNGEWNDTGSTWYRVTAWRELAENAAQSLTRGTRVIVTGILASRQWEDKEGNQRYTWEITADAIGPDMTFAAVAIAKSKRSVAPRKETVPAGNDPWITGEAAERTAQQTEEPPF
jgi:single-strand DNA-binding protein